MSTIETAIRALRFLADVERPAQGDQQHYNVAHLRQIADDLESAEVATGFALVVDRGSMDPNATKLDGGLLAQDSGHFHIYGTKERAPHPLDFERVVRVEVRAVR